MKKIILAEDDPGIQDATRMILERAGYHVTTFSDATLLMQNSFDIPDLFLLDKQLSGFNGMQVCQHLKNQSITSHVPVIMISASPDIKQCAMEAGADNALEKPFRKKVLMEMINKHISGATDSTY